MSRSYKKHPYCTDGSPKTTKERKQLANKRVRRCKKDMDKKGKKYKQLYESYDIHDYINRWTWEKAKEEYENDIYSYWKERYPTLKEFYRFWSKYYKRK